MAEYEYEVFCPSEKWRLRMVGPLVPRDGDELMYKNMLYKCSSVRHLAVDRDSDMVAARVYLLQIFVSPLK